MRRSKRCPECGAPMSRVYMREGKQFKGVGWLCSSCSNPNRGVHITFDDYFTPHIKRRDKVTCWSSTLKDFCVGTMRRLYIKEGTSWKGVGWLSLPAFGVNTSLIEKAMEKSVEKCVEMSIKDFLINSVLPVDRGAKHRELEPKEEDYEKLCEGILKPKDEAIFRNNIIVDEEFWEELAEPPSTKSHTRECPRCRTEVYLPEKTWRPKPSLRMILYKCPRCHYSWRTVEKTQR